MIRASAVAFATLLGSTSLTSVSMAQSPASSSAPTSGGFATSDATDPYIWLEEVEGDRDRRRRSRRSVSRPGEPRSSLQSAVPLLSGDASAPAANASAA